MVVETYTLEQFVVLWYHSSSAEDVAGALTDLTGGEVGVEEVWEVADDLIRAGVRLRRSSD